MAIFTTLSVVIWFSTGTLGIFATLVYVFTMRVVIYDILSMALITTLSTSTRREFHGNFYHTCLCFYYACGHIRHTEYGNNYHTIDFHTVL